jgi:hypothetical protein
MTKFINLTIFSEVFHYHYFRSPCCLVSKPGNNTILTGIFQEVAWGGVDWIDMAQGTGRERQM